MDYKIKVEMRHLYKYGAFTACLAAWFDIMLVDGDITLTVDEIAEEMGVSNRTIRNKLKPLLDDGIITRNITKGVCSCDGRLLGTVSVYGKGLNA